MGKIKSNRLTKVTVIVPVYNAENNISKLLESLLIQNYSKPLIRIIIVDNNSKDRTKEIVKKYPVDLIEETGVQSSYSARNTGIMNAETEVLAFIDSDCIALKNWLFEGIKLMIEKSAYIVGGNVQFTYSKNKTLAELYDSTVNMQIESNIKDRKVAKTANLFVRSEVFNKIGLFPDGAISGGDVQWTAMATKRGYKIEYTSKAIVLHPARRLRELFKKQFRVGQGIKLAWKGEGKSNLKFLYIFFIGFFPPKLYSIKNLPVFDEKTKAISNILKLWFIAYCVNLSTRFGIIYSIIKRKG